MHYEMYYNEDEEETTGKRIKAYFLLGRRGDPESTVRELRGPVGVTMRCISNAGKHLEEYVKEFLSYKESHLSINEYLKELRESGSQNQMEPILDMTIGNYLCISDYTTQMDMCLEHLSKIQDVLVSREIKRPSSTIPNPLAPIGMRKAIHYISYASGYLKKNEYFASQGCLGVLKEMKKPIPDIPINIDNGLGFQEVGQLRMRTGVCLSHLDTMYCALIGQIENLGGFAKNEEAAKQSWQLGTLMLEIRAILEKTPAAICWYSFPEIPVVFKNVCRNFLATMAVEPKFERVIQVARSANTIAYYFKKRGVCRTPYARDTVFNLRWALEIVLEFLEQVGRSSTYSQLDESARLFVRERQQLRKNFNKLNTCLAKI